MEVIMMKKIESIVFWIEAVVVIAAMSVVFAIPNAEMATSDTQINLVVDEKFVFELKEENGSGEFGRAIIFERDGKAVVQLEVFMVPEGVTQPAHIHVGNVPNVGAIKYPLNPVVDGLSETELTVNLEKLRNEMPLAVNVHKSQTNLQSVAVGDLKF